MAVTALMFYTLFGVLGFGWRSWLQYQQTGSTGFHGNVSGTNAVQGQHD